LNRDLHKGDIYAFVFTFKGICVAHGAVPALDGKNLMSVKDPNGKYTIRIASRLAQRGGGWYNYKWPNPKTHMIDNKASFVEKLDENYLVVAGVYRR